MTEKICTLLFLRRGDEILLAMKKRGFGAGRYNGVGGKIEADETIDKALIRECQEEIEVTPAHYWKVAEHDFVQNTGEKPWRMYVHAYLCDKWEGDPVETEEMAPEWFNLRDIPYDTMWSGDNFWIPEVLAGKKISGVFSFDEQDDILTHDIQEVEYFSDDATKA
jgi:ADP-ribose pyrophosphatase YjhB (NUDIX family)